MAVEKGRIVLVGRTGAGKSTLVNMLVNGNLNPPHLAEMGNGLHGTTKICETFVGGRGWTVIDTMGFGEPDTGSVSNTNAQKLVIDFLKKVKGRYSHIIFVIEKGRFDLVTEIIWKTFLQIFKGGERNFVVLFTKTDDEWLQENLEQIKTEFPECKQFQYVDFPEIDDDPEFEKENSEIRMSERDRLESELTRMFAGSWVEPDIFRMGDAEIEKKAENILVYIAKLIKSMLQKYGAKALQNSVTIFVAVVELVTVFAGGF